MKYPLTNKSFGTEERAAILSVVNSDRLTMGERVKEFEQEFASFAGKKYAMMFNSGSSANLVAIAALYYKGRIRRGDEVIVPALSWSTTYSPLQQYGLKLKVVDITDTLNIDVAQLENALTSRTTMVVAVNILGNPAQLDAIRAFANRHELAFFEDNCESMGATLYGRQCGSYGDIGTFSSFYTHHMNTIEGGMLVTDDWDLYEIALSLREHGWDRYLKPDGGFYNFIIPGYNVRPTEITAALGLMQLNRLPDEIRVRRRNAELFKELFGNDDRFKIQRENGESSWFSFTMISPDRRYYLTRMNEAGIEYRMICGGCFTEHPSAKHYNFEPLNGLPKAKEAHWKGFFVGNWGTPMDEQLHWLKESL